MPSHGGGRPSFWPFGKSAQAASAPSKPPSLPLELLGSSAQEGDVIASTGSGDVQAPHPPQHHLFGHSHGPNQGHTPATAGDRREVECFECHTITRASLHATSTACPHCGTYIDLRSFEIRDRTTQKIRTRGDVTVHKKGALLGTAIHCGSLTVEGVVSGSIYAQDKVEFLVSTKVVGELRCRRLVIARKCLVHCLQPVHTGEVEIAGQFTGRIFATGPVRLLNSHSRLEGSVNAPSFSMPAGAELEASMHIFGLMPEG